MSVFYLIGRVTVWECRDVRGERILTLDLSGPVKGTRGSMLKRRVSRCLLDGVLDISLQNPLVAVDTKR